MRNSFPLSHSASPTDWSIKSHSTRKHTKWSALALLISTLASQMQSSSISSRNCFLMSRESHLLNPKNPRNQNNQRSSLSNKLRKQMWRLLWMVRWRPRRERERGRGRERGRERMRQQGGSSSLQWRAVCMPAINKLLNGLPLCCSASSSTTPTTSSSTGNRSKEW